MANRVYETIIKIGAAISKSFRGDTLNAAKALNKLGQEAATAKAKYNQASEALRRLEAAEKASGKASKESARWIKAGEREVAKAAKEYDRATKAVQTHNKELQKLHQTEMSRIRKRIFGERDKTPLLRKARGQLGSIAREAVYLGSAALGAGVGVFALVEKIGNAGDATAKMAKRIGIGVEALQELRYAGEREGATAEEVDNALGKMLITIGKFKAAKGKGGSGGFSVPGFDMLSGSKSGGGAETNPFAQLHLDAKKLAQMKPERQFEAITDGLRKLKTDAERASVAQQIFGREGGLKIIPLVKSADGIAKLRKEARELGHVLSKEALEQAEEFNDRMLDAKLAATGLANTFVVELLPAVTETFKDFTQWVKTNRTQIKQWGEAAAKWIGKEGIPLLKGLGKDAIELAKGVGSATKALAEFVGGYGRLGKILIAVRLLPVAVTMFKIGREVRNASLAWREYREAVSTAQALGTDMPKMSKLGQVAGAAATASMLAGAASVGYAIGTALDQYLSLSDKIVRLARRLAGQDESEKEVEDINLQAHNLMLQRKGMERDSRVRQFMAQGLTRGQALYAAEHPNEPLPTPTTQPGGPKKVRGGNVTQINVPISMMAGTKEDVDRALDEARRKLHDEIDRKAATKRRTSFAE